MTRWLVASAALSVATASSGARAGEPAPTWVFFADKQVGHRADALAARATELSSRALARRQNARADGGLDERDLAVAPHRIAAVAATGARVRATSRWLNAVSVVADAEQLAAIAALSDVVRTQPVARRSRAPDDGLGASGRGPVVLYGDDPGMYGVAADQLALIGVPDMHGCGLDGAGVVVAVLDSGFLLTHKALTHIDVLAQHDFIKGDDIVADETGDPPGQHNHGTSVLSLLAGRDLATYVGVAPEVTVILAKTEDISLEQPIEEDWFVEGLEWAEGLGADLATASLGYIDWYEPSDFDGQTAVTTIAANVAMQNGLVMIAAAGNWGPEPTTIGAPADADKLIAVGAVDLGGNVTNFSSRGPTFDGRIKPDVCAVGQDDWVVVPNTPDGYTQGNGTSYAAPLVAGVAALLKQAYPKLGAVEMHALLTSTATQAAAPDNTLGYGIVRGFDAAGLYCTCVDSDADGFYHVGCGGTDCDDAAADVSPAAMEQCNGIDDDCDGMLLPGEEDADGDGALACDDDCDDDDPEARPGAAEACEGGVDEDCDGATDQEDPDCAPPPEEEEEEEDDDGPLAAPPPGSTPVEGGCGCRVHGQADRALCLPGWLCALVVAASRRRSRRRVD